jgi:immune inhibitor A
MWTPTDGSSAFSASNSYQMHDAAFSLRKSATFSLDQTALYKRTLSDNNTFMRPFFDDSRSFMNAATPNTGRNIPKLGVKIYVTGESRDRSTASILIKK